MSGTNDLGRGTPLDVIVEERSTVYRAAEREVLRPSYTPTQTSGISSGTNMEVENGPLEDHFPLQTGGAIHFHVSSRESKPSPEF